ncbi:MAG: hypothetical protein ABIG95_03395, partial [Candidatus Woesearchaeota archaeon]
YLNSSTIVCQLNNSHQVTKEVELVLESLYNTQTQTITLEPERLTAVSYAVKPLPGKNPFFIKLFLNRKLIDLQEIIISNPEPKPKPFTLSSNISFNNATNIFTSSQLKSKEYVLYLSLAGLAVITLFSFWRKPIF